MRSMVFTYIRYLLKYYAKNKNEKIFLIPMFLYLLCVYKMCVMKKFSIFVYEGSAKSKLSFKVKVFKSRPRFCLMIFYVQKEEAECKSKIYENMMNNVAK